MHKKFYLISLIVILSLVGTGCKESLPTTVTSSPTSETRPAVVIDESDPDHVETEETMRAEKEAYEKQPHNEEEESKTNTNGYIDYSPETLRAAHAVNKKVILFFKATWCPSCKALDEDIKTRLSDIPNNIAILKVNFDTANDLKKKYQVTYQHTFVQVDKEGAQIKKWSGSPTLEKLLSEVQ